MTDCTSCSAALRDRNSGLYRADCLDCQARAVARSPQYFDARQAAAITPAYRDVLQRVFGGMSILEAHERVKRWA